MASSLISLYDASPNVARLILSSNKVCALNTFHSYTHMPQINKLTFCEDLSLQHTFAHVHMMPQQMNPMYLCTLNISLQLEFKTWLGDMLSLLETQKDLTKLILVNFVLKSRRSLEEEVN
jgi:hypothetical protein